VWPIVKIPDERTGKVSIHGGPKRSATSGKEKISKSRAVIKQANITCA
jgi:hypothetical protein